MDQQKQNQELKSNWTREDKHGNTEIYIPGLGWVMQ